MTHLFYLCKGKCCDKIGGMVIRSLSSKNKVLSFGCAGRKVMNNDIPITFYHGTSKFCSNVGQSWHSTHVKIEGNGEIGGRETDKQWYEDLLATSE